MGRTMLDQAERAARAWGSQRSRDISIRTSGVGGLVGYGGVYGRTLGGGIGHLTRQCGLTVDNLLSVDMVLADGRFVTASAKENPDLFWAVRGGGGNFGVVTAFLFKAHPIHTSYAGPMLWSMEDAAEILRWYRGFIGKVPNALNGFFAFLTVPPGPPFPTHLHNKKMRGCVVLHRTGSRTQNA